MKRSSPIIVRMTDATLQVRIVLEMDPTEPGTYEHRKSKFDLLRMIADQPELSQCHGEDFQKISIFFDGSKWTADCSAIVKGTM